MTPFNLLAAALQNRGAYELAAASGEAAVLPEELVPVWEALTQFYTNDEEAGRADPDIVQAYAAEGLSNPKHAEAVAATVQRLAATEISSINVREMLRLVALGRVRDKLSHSLSARHPDEKIQALMAEYAKLTNPIDDDEDEEPDWEDIVARRLDPQGRMKVAPRALNEFLGGGLLPGHNVTVFARPEAGKSALAITMSCGFARRGHKVLYVINEDSVQDIMVRMLSCCTGLDRAGILENPTAAIAKGMKAGLGRIVARELAPGSLGELEQLVKRHKPQILVVDQIRNLKMSKTDNFVQGLDHVAQGIRSLGKRYGMVTIGLTQAGDSASGRPVLEMGDVDSSNTGIPGAADVLIGLGVTDTLRNAGQRVLSVSKNKVSGQKGYFTVNIREQISRITSHER